MTDPEPSESRERARFPPSFELNSLMLVIALVAACTMVMRVSLAFGIALAILSALALFRTVLQIATRPAGERGRPVFDKVIGFFVSFAIVFVIGMIALISSMLTAAICFGCGIRPALGLLAEITAAGGTGYAAHRLIRHAIEEWQW